MSEQATETETKTNEKTRTVRPRTRFMWFRRGRFRQPNGHANEDLVALMVAGFSDNHSETVRTADDRPPTNGPVEPENTDSRNPCQRKTLDKDCGCLSVIEEAERQGFEPWVPLRVLRFSRPVR